MGHLNSCVCVPFCVPNLEMSLSLNVTALNNLPKTGKYYERADRDGLSARVSPNGKVTFQFRYRFGNLARRMKLGTYPATSLKDARERLRTARHLLDEGNDPIVDGSNPHVKNRSR
jgi:hypothetical protein